MNGQSHGIAGSAVHFDQFTFMLNSDRSEIRAIFEFVDHDVSDVSSQRFNGRFEQVVSQGPWWLFTLDTTIDAGRLEQTDQDRKFLMTVHFTQKNDLLVIHFADDDPSQFHLNEHNWTPKVA